MYIKNYLGKNVLKLFTILNTLYVLGLGFLKGFPRTESTVMLVKSFGKKYLKREKVELCDIGVNEKSKKRVRFVLYLVRQGARVFDG